jgi:hypothetical protein
VSSWLVKWARSVEAMGLVRESGGMLWNMVPASRCALTRHLSVGGVVCHDGFSGPVGVCGGDGVDVRSDHVASITGVVNDFM